MKKFVMMFSILVVFAIVTSSAGAATTPFTNPIPNPGFESGLWATAFYGYPTAYGHDTGSSTLDSTVFHSGTHSMKVTLLGLPSSPAGSIAALGLVSTAFGVTAGGQYTMTAWFKDGGSGGVYNISFGVVFLDSGGNMIGADNDPQILVSAWTQYSQPLSVPSGAVAARAFIIGLNRSEYPNPETFYADDFNIVGDGVSSITSTHHR